MNALLPWAQYNRSGVPCKWWRPRAAAVLLAGLLAGPVAPAGELEITSGPGRVGELVWEQLELVYVPASAGRVGRWRLLADGLATEAAGELGRVDIECTRGEFGPQGPVCEQGALAWHYLALELSWQAAFTIEARPQESVVRFSSDALNGVLNWPLGDGAVFARVEMDGLDLSGLPGKLLEAAGLSALAGRLSGTAMLDSETVQGALRLRGGGFDSIDGMVAADGLDLALEFTLQTGQEDLPFDFAVIQQDGEWLAGSVYLPPSESSLELRMAGNYRADGQVEIRHMTLDDPGALQLEGAFSLIQEAGAWALDAMVLDRVEIILPGGWSRWAEGPLAARGLGDLATEGTVRASLAWRNGRLAELVTRELSLSLHDPAGRFGIDRIVAEIVLHDQDLTAEFRWDGLDLYGLPFGPSSAIIEGDQQFIRLGRALRLPLLDGAVVVERLVWGHQVEGGRELVLDALIEPVGLTALTRLLEFPEFGGVLSGRFPGVVYADQRLNFTGGIDVQAFSGRITMSDLAVERPFGTLPALSAQVEFSRLDLAEVTGAFNFGHMEGQLSGWMRDLRLLDWRPVAMDARLYTHEDAPRRRISQRAVENLSSLGGAPGGALVSGTVMRVFSEFPYRRAGLACRLSNNICYIDGVAPHESGGFYIVEGRALPRLDIIGHRRLVDWPQLIRQLESMMDD